MQYTVSKGFPQLALFTVCACVCLVVRERGHLRESVHTEVFTICPARMYRSGRLNGFVWKCVFILLKLLFIRPCEIVILSQQHPSSEQKPSGDGGEEIERYL